MRLGVVITTYNWPEALELTLEGYAAQDRRPDQIIVADDGSSTSTREMLAQTSGRLGLPLLHVWHEDRGFRKTEILNRAVAAMDCDYLVFTDGDCIPRHDFLSAHQSLARVGRFLSSGCIRLSEQTTERVTSDGVRSGRAFDPSWLEANGTPLGAKRLRLLPQGSVIGRFLDAVTTTRPTFNGMGSSVWRSDLERVNGFNLDFVYGGLDRELGERLTNAGIRGAQVRYRTPLLHLYHDRPWKNPEAIRKQREARAETRRSRRVRAEQGLHELEPSSDHRVEVLGEG